MNNLKIENSLKLNPQILIFSDIHLHKHRNTSIFLDVAETILKNILNICDDKNIKTIFFLGDWFHKKDKVGTEELFITFKFLKELEKRDITMIALVGNHDFLYTSNDKNQINTIQFFKLSKNVEVIQEYDSFIFNDIQFYFLSWTWNNELLKKLFFISQKNKNAKKHIFFGHIELKNFDLNEFTLKSNISEIDLNFLIKNFDRTFLGHYHDIFRKDNLLCVGNPFQQSFGDINKIKGIWIYDINSDKITFIQNNISPNFKKILMSNILKNKVNIEEIKNSFIKIILDTEAPSEKIIQIKEILSKNNFSVEMIFDYSDDKKENSLDLTEDEKFRKKLILFDLNNSMGIKQFFNDYLNLFPNLENKERLKNIIEREISNGG